MAEKVIHELRIIETDDGFRIEIKGDKEELKKMGLGKMFRSHGGGFGGFGGFKRGWGRHGGFPFRPPHPAEDTPDTF